MLKFEIAYIEKPENYSKAIEITAYYPRRDGDYAKLMEVSSFNAGMLDRLSQKSIRALIESLNISLEICAKGIEIRLEEEAQRA